MMGVLDPVLWEIKQADMALALEGTSAIMALLGETILAKMGYPPEGKADVKFLIEDTTQIVISWEGIKDAVPGV